MRVLIIGASGLAGGNFFRYFHTKEEMTVQGTHYSYPTSFTNYYDTLNPDSPGNFNIQEFAPDVIVHCGALTHVDYCEDHPEESYLKTVVSFRNTLETANQIGAKIVYLSTDYVFDGKSGPYVENDAQNPLSAYAKHKAEAEALALSASNSLVLRITNVYGDEERNKNFVSRIIEKVQKNQKLTLKLPFDQYATPVNALDLAKAAYLLLRDGKQGIYHISSTDFLNRVELALRVLKYFPKAQYDLIPMSTEELNQPAPRPLLGGLISAKFSSEYPEFLFSNIDDYVKRFV